MRKNFFKKKLATTVALAMVVASLSVPSSAQAAVATKIVKQGGGAAPTVLYVGDKGADYGLSKTVKGNTYAWTTSNSAIATISKAGVVTPKAPGTVTIKCTARDSKGKWLKAFTQKLTINLRATSIDVNAADFELAMGESKDLNAVKTPAKSTDAVRYYSDNTKVATVDAKSGVVKAVGVGEATITVYSKATYKSATASKYNKTDSVKVSVKDGIQAVKQTVSNALEVTFATDQKGKVTDSNLTITDADGVKQTIDDISFSTDGKTATVTTFLDYEDGETYKVAYDNTEKSFTASVGEVASVVLKAKTVQYDEVTDLDYAAYDKNGVDVSSKVDWENDVDFDYDETDAEIAWDLEDDGDDVNQIRVFDYPESVDVEMTYTYFDEETGEDTDFTSKATIKSVEELAHTASDIQYTLADETDYNDIDWDDDLNTTIPEDADGYQLFINAEDENGDDIYEWNFDSFESTDDDILTVSYDEDNAGEKGNDVYVYPVKAGTAYIKAVYGDTVKTLKVTVGDEPEAKTIKVNDSSIELYSSFSGYANGVDVDIEVDDQYGDEIEYDDFDDIEAPDHRSGDSEDVISTSLVDENTVRFYLNTSTVGSDEDGNNTYKIDIAGKTVSVTVKVIAVDSHNTAIKSIALVADDNDIDANVDDDFNDVAGDDDSEVAKYTVYGLNSDGDRVRIMNAATDVVTFSLEKDGDDLAVADYADEGFVFNDSTKGLATFTAVGISPSDSSVVSQASVATYKVTVNATWDSDGSGTITSADKHDDATTTLKITNSQKLPKVTFEEKEVDIDDVSGNDVAGLIAEAFSFDLGEAELGDGLTLVEADVVNGSVKKDGAAGLIVSVDSGDSVRVKSVTLRYELPDTHGYSIDITVDINETVHVVD